MGILDRRGGILNTDTTWRDKFRPMIAELIEGKHADIKDARKLRTILNSECPFWAQASLELHQLWRDEVFLATRRMGRPSAVDGRQKFLEMG